MPEQYLDWQYSKRETALLLPLLTQTDSNGFGSQAQSCTRCLVLPLVNTDNLTLECKTTSWDITATIHARVSQSSSFSNRGYYNKIIVIVEHSSSSRQYSPLQSFHVSLSVYQHTNQLFGSFAGIIAMQYSQPAAAAA